VLHTSGTVEAKIFQPPAQGCDLPPGVVRYREAPYEHGDWRTVGITTRMVQDVAYAIRGKIIVICGKVCVHSYQHPTWTNDYPLMVFNIWRGHAFLYTPEAHCAASKLPTMRSITASRTRDRRMYQPREDEDLTKSYASMLQLKLPYPFQDEDLSYKMVTHDFMTEAAFECFHSLLAANPGAVFYHSRMEEVESTLREHRISFHAVFSSPTAMSSIITEKNRFRPWVDNATVLNHVATDLGVANGVHISYCREPSATFGSRCLEALMPSRRQYMSMQDREARLALQGGKCDD